MSIDADLNSGLINENEARARRKALASEAEFYGAMDGASRFTQRGAGGAGRISRLAGDSVPVTWWRPRRRRVAHASKTRRRRRNGVAHSPGRQGKHGGPHAHRAADNRGWTRSGGTRGRRFELAALAKNHRDSPSGGRAARLSVAPGQSE